MKIANAAASSKLQGLGYLTSSSGTLTIPGYSQGANSGTTFTLDIPANSGASTTMSQVRVNGTNSSRVNNIWFQLDGSTYWRMSAPSYDVSVVLYRVGTIQRCQVRVYNSTGASQSVPTLTIDVKSFFYSAPW